MKKSLKNVDKTIATARTIFVPEFEDFYYPDQEAYLRDVFTCPEQTIIYKAARQSGKTFLTALAATIYMVSGHTVIFAYPKQNQGEDIMTTNVKKFLKAYIKNRKLKESFIVENSVRRIILSNGGKMTVVSTGSDRVDGYTSDLTVIDEGQSHNWEDLHEKVIPFTNVSRQVGLEKGLPYRGRIIILGRGGAKGSFIEKEWVGNPIAHKILMDAGRICQQWPSYKSVVDAAEAASPHHIFRSNYFCDPLPSEGSDIFSNIKVEDRHIMSFPRIGIDWGKRRDTTVGVALYEMDNELYIQDIKIINLPSYTACAQGLKLWMDEFEWNEDFLYPELNGVGDAAIEILQPILGVTIMDKGAFINEDTKHNAILKLMHSSEKGRIVVANEKIKQALLGLTYKINEKSGKMKADHSDVLSALIMAVPDTLFKAHTL